MIGTMATLYAFWNSAEFAPLELGKANSIGVLLARMVMPRAVCAPDRGATVTRAGCLPSNDIAKVTVRK